MKRHSVAPLGDYVRESPAGLSGGKVIKETEEAVKYHDMGVDGDKDAVKRAYEEFKELYEKYPDNRLIEAYLGSATTLMGRDAFKNNERFQLAVDGLSLLDRAVSGEPDNVDIRMLRGNVCFRLPETYFHRRETVIEDFGFIVSKYEGDKKSTTREIYLQALYTLGKAHKTAKNSEKANACWDKLLLHAGEDSEYYSLVKREGFVQDTISDKETISPKDTRTALEGTLYDDEELDKGFLLHKEAYKGRYGTGSASNQRALDAAYDYFEKAHGRHPEDPVITAYYADCLSLKGNKDSSPASMFGSAIKAAKLFDEAVSSAPENIQIRFLRAGHSYRIPEAFFKRTLTAIMDFEYILKSYEKNPDMFSERFYWRVSYLLGKSYQRIEKDSEAGNIFKRLLSVCNDPGIIEMVKKEQESQSETGRINNKDFAGEGIRLHNLGVNGNRKAALKSLELLEKAYEANPNDAVIQGYYGSSMALAGKYSLDSDTMFGNAVSGMKQVKEAISKSRNNPELRFLHAMLLYNLPSSFFPVTEKAIKEFRYITSAYERNHIEYTAFAHKKPLSAVKDPFLTREIYLKSLYHLGSCYNRMSQNQKALKVLKKMKKVDMDSPYYKELKEIVEGWEEK